jgi:hypothetical protein
MTDYAIYNTATRQILFFTGGPSPPTSTDMPDGAAAGTLTQPRPTSGLWAFNDDGTLAAYSGSLADAWAAALCRAIAHYNGLIAAGFTWSGTLYQIDAASQASIAAMGIMALGSIAGPAGSPWPAGFDWIAADNSHVPLDAAAMYAFGRAVADYVSACVLRLRALKDAIAAAADRAALDAIDVTAGYPAASA